MPLRWFCTESVLGLYSLCIGSVLDQDWACDGSGGSAEAEVCIEVYIYDVIWDLLATYTAV